MIQYPQQPLTPLYAYLREETPKQSLIFLDKHLAQRENACEIAMFRSNRICMMIPEEMERWHKDHVVADNKKRIYHDEIAVIAQNHLPNRYFLANRPIDDKRMSLEKEIDNVYIYRVVGS